MTLRLRRGTDLERQSITFQEGELVYITDTKDLYAGDGTTVGGIKVSNIGSPSSLTQNLNLNGYSIQGSGTISATSFIGDGSALTGIDIGVQAGQEYDINIRGNVRSFDSTILVDSITNNIYGNFYGDGSNLTNIAGTIVPSGDYTINILGYVKSFNDEIIIDPSTKTVFGDFVGVLQGSLVSEDSTLLVDAGSNSFFGTFIGDGSLLTGITVDQLADTDINLPLPGEVLQYDGVNWVNVAAGTAIVPGSNYSINIVGSDSTTLVNADNNTINGTFQGTIDSTEGATITMSDTGPGLIINNPVSNLAGGKITINGFGGTFASPTAPSAFHRQGLLFKFYDGVGFEDNSLINSYYRTSGAGYLSLSVVDTAGAFFNTAIELDGETQTVIVTGTLTSTGTITAASFKGSVVGDDSTTIVDAINGTVSASGYVQFGSYTTVDRDLLIAANGMVIYNSTANRFQGYQNNAWINLDDGTAA